MSRTDKTNPFWVKLDRGDLASDEWHDHSDGTCDLPPALGRDAYGHATRCHREFRYTGVPVCCCPMCHGDGWQAESQRRRRERRTAKRRMRDWATEYEDAA